MSDKVYLIIDMKSFYASCECVMRGLDPMTTDLVVADEARGRGTICLAVSPSLKAKGVRNRCRLFEIPAGYRYITAVPRMELYLNYAAEVYSLYLDYFCKDDIFVYSVDEAFIDITGYRMAYRMTPHQLAKFLLQEIRRRLGLPATCGIGTNLYLAKIALDITAKHSPDRIGFLDEARFQKTLWHHQPLTDFWRIGPGIARRLHRLGLRDLGAVAHAPFALIRQEFGIDACLLYDHAWGREPTTIAQIKAYAPAIRSVSAGQVLPRDYTYAEARIVLVEMADQLALDMTKRQVVSQSISLSIGYSRHSDQQIPYTDGTAHLPEKTNASSLITAGLLALFERTALRERTIRRILLCAEHTERSDLQELSLFAPDERLHREHTRQLALLRIQAKHGKNALLRGTDLLSAGTRRERNKQIGGHKAHGNGETVQPRQDLPAL